MANEKNLKPNKTLSSEEAKSMGTKGGRASGEARRKKRALKDCLETLLSFPMQTNEGIRFLLEVNGANADYQNAIGMALLHKALEGDSKAFEVIRDTIGQKPNEKLQLEALEPVSIKIDYGD